MPLSAVSETAVDVEAVADTLVARGYHEVITYSFVDKTLDETISGKNNELTLSNPISSEMSVMRASLWPGMLQTAASNLARQRERVRIFELGSSYHGTRETPEEVRRIAGSCLIGRAHDEHWSNKSQNTDFYDVKADLGGAVQFGGVDRRRTVYGGNTCRAATRSDSCIASRRATRRLVWKTTSAHCERIRVRKVVRCLCSNWMLMRPSQHMCQLLNLSQNFLQCAAMSRSWSMMTSIAGGFGGSRASRVAGADPRRQDI